jgi:hypothetical protein
MLKKLLAAALGVSLAVGIAAPAHAASSNQFTLDLWTLQDPDPNRPEPNYYQGPNLAEWRPGAGLPDGNGGGNDANTALYFQKFTGTFTDSGAGAYIRGIKGITLSELGYDFRADSHCGAGAPRFNVYVEGMGEYYFSLGCYYGNRHSTDVPGAPGWKRIRFSDADVYPSRSNQAPWPGFGNVLISDLWIVFDEGLDQGNGYFYMDNIDINGTLIGAPPRSSALTTGNGGGKGKGK